MRLGLSSFLNSKPFLSLSDHYESLIAAPKDLALAFKEEKLDASLLSTEAFFRSPEKLFIQPFGIGSLNKTQSVLLFLKKPDDACLKIAVTRSSETSIVLLEVILTHFWERPFTLIPSANPSKEEASGYLLIGDEALFHKSPFPVFDLATLWHEYTGLPFVFALFASRNPRPDLGKALEASLTQFFVNVEREEHKEYFTCLSYKLDCNHFKGMTLFHALRQKLPRYH